MTRSWTIVVGVLVGILCLGLVASAVLIMRLSDQVSGPVAPSLTPILDIQGTVSAAIATAMASQSVSCPGLETAMPTATATATCPVCPTCPACPMLTPTRTPHPWYPSLTPTATSTGVPPEPTRTPVPTNTSVPTDTPVPTSPCRTGEGCIPTRVP